LRNAPQAVFALADKHRVVLLVGEEADALEAGELDLRKDNFHVAVLRTGIDEEINPFLGATQGGVVNSVRQFVNSDTVVSKINGAIAIDDRSDRNREWDRSCNKAGWRGGPIPGILCEVKAWVALVD
jgi:hypothetical protein